MAHGCNANVTNILGRNGTNSQFFEGRSFEWEQNFGLTGARIPARMVGSAWQAGQTTGGLAF